MPVVRPRRTVIPILLVSLLPPCATATPQDSVLGVANEFITALRTDDLDRFRRVTDAGFYAFDAGRKFSGTELAIFVKDAHAQGMRFSWSITDPVVHVNRDIAWLTYVNQGSVETQAGNQPVTWLESMVLEYRHSHWHIRFLHSTRVPSPK